MMPGSSNPETFVALVHPKEPVKLFAPLLHNPREVVLQLQSRNDKSASVVIQMPDPITTPTTPAAPDTTSFRAKFKERNPLLLGAWATAMLSMAYLKSHLEESDNLSKTHDGTPPSAYLSSHLEGSENSVKMHFGSSVIGVSFLAWIVLLLICETTKWDLYKRLLGKFLLVSLYGICYGGALLGLGVAFTTVYLPKGTHMRIQAILFAAIILGILVGFFVACCGKDEATNEAKKEAPADVAGGGDAAMEMGEISGQGEGERSNLIRKRTPPQETSMPFQQFQLPKVSML